jgi:catechol 2,3-dioxygenase
MNNTRLHPETHIGLVALTVADLARSVAFYTDLLGFHAIERAAQIAVLGTAASQPLLLLAECPGVRPKPTEATGLYHFAILLPTRADLARAVRHVDSAGFPFQASYDHLVSEAFYLADPDGNGVEIYRDRPRSAWPWRDGRIRAENASGPVDVEDLLAELEEDGCSWDGLPEGTHIGHIHLQAADLGAAAAFYGDVLGFDEAITGIAGALFLAAGGYHHHIATNTWNSSGAEPPADAAGLRFFTITVPDRTELARLAARLEASDVLFTRRAARLTLRDPWGHGLVLTAGKLSQSKEVLAMI